MNPMLLEKILSPYKLNLMLNSNQGLALFRQTQTLSRHKNLHKQQWNFSDIWLITGWILWK